MSYEIIKTITKDCYTINTDPLVNKDGASLSASSTSRYTFVGVDLSGLAGKNIVSAEYEMRFSANTGTGTFTMSAHRVDADWGETTITYNNMPGIVGSALGTLDFSGGTLGTKILTFTNMEEFAKMANDNKGFRVSIAGSTICNWYSRTGAVPPIFRVVVESKQKIYVL